MPDPAPAAAPTPGGLRSRYAEAFRAWLAHRDERALGTAYDLGREAVRAQLSVLDLAEAHHDAARAALRDEGDPGRRGERLLRRGALHLRDRAPRLPRGAGGRAARARARDAAAGARRRVRAH